MPNGSARILLVDDEQSIQTLLSFPLRKDGYHVTSATDGNEALQRFTESRFDLVIAGGCAPAARSRSSC
jgi:CheY-like chemotaxis protein